MAASGTEYGGSAPPRGYAAEAALALEAVRAACLVADHVQHRMEMHVQAKDDTSPVTIADLAAQAVMNRAWRREFPDEAVVGEEDADALRADPELAARVTEAVSGGLAGTAWADSLAMDTETVIEMLDAGATDGVGSTRHLTLDPVDGTKGFIRRQQYAVCLALVVDGVPVVGALGCPHLPRNLASAPLADITDHVPRDGDTVERGVVAVASLGGGARLFALHGSAHAEEQGEEMSVRTAVPAAGDPVTLVESLARGHTAHEWSGDVLADVCAALGGCPAEVVRLDSQCKYVMVGSGRADLYLRRIEGHIENVWDHAAGALIVAEAGGVVTDVLGAALDFGLGSGLAANTGIVAASPAVHPHALATAAPKL